ncbi:MAG: glucoamylase family protein, partial [Planctomycetota bacterium]
TERAIRDTADALYRRVEWDWFQPRPPLVAMGWKPEPNQHTPDGFGRADYRGYNEAMFLYVLALGSPTHAIAPAAWESFCSEYTWDEFHGQKFVQFSPLFGHQYAACWIDLRGIQDAYMRQRGIDYFENSRRATLAQRAYAIANPKGWKGYGEDVWGLTACDGPGIGQAEYNGETRRFAGYWARGAGSERVDDDGTIAPTAAGGSIQFAPNETVRALQTMKHRYGEKLYGEYGFFDSFNPSCTDPDRQYRHGGVHEGIGWVNSDYLGIDQGPILLQAENHRSGFVWDVMRRSPYIQRGLRRAGFTGGWLNAETTDE